MGRHGGINILHQKSWHVWRMDNRLRVERDELQHAAKEADNLAAQRKEAFDGKLLKLRRAAGTEIGQKVGEKAIAKERTDPQERLGRDIQKGDDYGKYGVTKSNLMEAEKKLRSQTRKRDEGYWGKEGLGSGPHINLFEAAELEVQREAEAHAKHLRYQATNNELAEKAKKRPLSEFDEVAQEVPWYMKAQQVAEELTRRDSEHKKKWRRKHGQLVLEVTYKTKDTSDGTEAETESLLHPSLREEPKQSKESKKKKKKKKRKKKKGKQDKAQEDMIELRRQRQMREEAERQRAAQLCAR